MTHTILDTAHRQLLHDDATALAQRRFVLVSDRAAQEALAAEYDATVTELTASASAVLCQRLSFLR